MNETFWKNVRPVPRTMDEAYKTPTYAQSIWKCESEHAHGLSALLEKVTGYAFMFVFGFLVSAITVWLTRS